MRWKADWFADMQVRKRTLWRGVEAQHQVATMRLVDDLDEQQLLEQLLEDSKPPRPAHSEGTHYLLFTPFRYASAWPSRFRRPQEPGAWYGADDAATVAAEIARWRWRFLMDSEGLRDAQAVVELTFFQARFSGLELDITQPPWSRHRSRWRAEDYAECHALAAHVRGMQPAVQSIRYESARRDGAACQVVFELAALQMAQPPVQHTWTCKTTRERVLLVHEDERLQFDFG